MKSESPIQNYGNTTLILGYHGFGELYFVFLGYDNK